MQALIFFTLLLSWAFLKLRNVSLVIEMNCDEIYEDMMRDLKRQEVSTYILYIINLISIPMFAIFSLTYLLEGLFSSFLIFITFGQAALGNYESIAPMGYIIYFSICANLIRGIYINALGYKKLKSVEFLNLLEQSKSKESDTIATQDNTLTKDTKMSETIVETDKIVEGEDTKMSEKITLVALNAATGCLFAAAALPLIGILLFVLFLGFLAFM